MASETQIVNLALTMLGDSRILSLSDNTKQAREAKAVYEILRDSLISRYDWSFAMARAALPALSEAPPNEFAHKYQLPTDCLRVVMVGDYYVGVNLNDYVNYPSDEFSIEGREILTNLGAPLKIKYIKRITDTMLFASTFVTAFAADLAKNLAEPLTQSQSKKEYANIEYNRAIKDATAANAIEKPPVQLADDSWLISRL